ncbi:DUF6898 family protein [Hirschia litorea]|uniref:DUF6898 family protein n=1 Tax=Hirschia litorea TaxID=1199156 RepID=A0ABW2IGH9_9PROT
MTDSGHIYLEFNRIGNTMEVRAVDAHDGLEISFIAPSNSSESEILPIARNKLSYARRKIESKKNGNAEDANQPNSRRGIIV